MDLGFFRIRPCILIAILGGSTELGQYRRFAWLDQGVCDRSNLRDGVAGDGAGGRGEGPAAFVDQKCSLCHSVAGKGNVKGPLDNVGKKLTAADIRAWITDAQAMTAKTKATRTPAMKQFSLPTEDVDALVAYLSTLKK